MKKLNSDFLDASRIVVVMIIAILVVSPIVMLAVKIFFDYWAKYVKWIWSFV